MNEKQLQGSAQHSSGPRFAAKTTGALVICLGLCLIFNSSLAAGASMEEQNEAVARLAFLEYLNHKDFKSLEKSTPRTS
jgi:hypothetical protein